MFCYFLIFNDSNRPCPSVFRRVTRAQNYTNESTHNTVCVYIIHTRALFDEGESELVYYKKKKNTINQTGLLSDFYNIDLGRKTVFKKHTILSCPTNPKQ